MKHVLKFALYSFWLISVASAAEYHVRTTGSDAADGSATAPFRTIQRAADAAQPGDTITVHAGIYRERVDPPRGGESDAKRILYRAAPGERSEIRGSEMVTGWNRVEGRVWKAGIPNSLFKNFNPFADEISGPWFVPDPTAQDRTKVIDDGSKKAPPAQQKHHTGAVYIDGRWLAEAKDLASVFKPTDNLGWWYAEVGDTHTTVHADFGDQDPNQHEIEVNARQSVFYPSRNGIDYLTVRGFILRDAATPWAPPTYEQIGLIGVNWSRGWIIEDNEIRNSACAGITLGKYHTDRDKELSDTSGFKTLIDMARTHTIPWSRERIGQHLVRNNLIETCGQAGICGSLGGAFSTISGNVIRDIWVRRRFGGYEMGGIKLHGGVDVAITGNHIYRAHLGVWLDWMGQGARISRNLFHDNWRDLFLEGNHGPILVDNNIMLSTWWLNSQGTALAHNLMAGGMIKQGEDSRHLPLLSPHSTAWQSDENFPHGDDRFFNNVFAGPNHRLCDLPRCRMPDVFAGNVYLGDAKPRDDEPAPVVLSADPKIQLESRADGFYLRMNFDPFWPAAQRARLVTTETLSMATLPTSSPTPIPTARPCASTPIISAKLAIRAIPRQAHSRTPEPV